MKIFVIFAFFFLHLVQCSPTKSDLKKPQKSPENQELLLPKLEQTFQLKPLFEHRALYRQAVEESYILAHGINEELNEFAEKCTTDYLYYHELVWPYKIPWYTILWRAFRNTIKENPTVVNIEPLITEHLLFWKFVSNNLEALKRDPFPSTTIYRLFVEVVRLLYTYQNYFSLLSNYCQQSAQYWSDKRHMDRNHALLQQKNHEIYYSVVKLTQKMFVLQETDLKNQIDQINRRFVELLKSVNEQNGRHNGLTSVTLVFRLFGLLARILKTNDAFMKKLRSVLEIKPSKFSFEINGFNKMVKQNYEEVKNRSLTGEFLVEQMYYESYLRAQKFFTLVHHNRFDFILQQKELKKIVDTVDREQNLTKAFPIPKISQEELLKLERLPDLDSKEFTNEPINSFEDHFITDYSYENSRGIKRKAKKLVTVSTEASPSREMTRTKSLDYESDQNDLIEQAEKSKEICQQSMTYHGSKKYRYNGLLSKFQFDPEKKYISVVPRTNPILLKVDEMQDLCRLGKYIKGSETMKWDRVVKIFERLGARVDDKFGGSREQVIFPIDPALLHDENNSNSKDTIKPIVVTRMFHRPHESDLGHVASAVSKFIKNDLNLRYDQFELED